MSKRFRLAKLTAAVVAAAAFQGGSAATLNPAGTGEYLIYPYYTTNGGFSSQIRIVNTTNAFKIVKLRFRESSHSEDVFDILIYLTPRDEFHGIVERVGDRYFFRSNDTTCTYPLNPTWYPTAVPWEFKPKTNVTAKDLSEGYAEVAEVATIPVGTPIFVDTDGDGFGDTSLLSVLLHAAATRDIDDDKNNENTGEPNGGAKIRGNRGPCAILLDAWARGVAPALNGRVNPLNWSSAAYPTSPPQIPAAPAAPLLHPPEGGLWGYMAYINAKDVLALVSDAVAIEHYSDLVQHYRTDDLRHFHLPNLASGGVQTALFIDADRDWGARVTWESIADDDAVNPIENPNAPFPMDRDGVNEDGPARQDSSLEAMASQLLAAGVMNDYFLDPDAGMAGATNWVVTFPAAVFGAWDVDREADPLGNLSRGSDLNEINLNKEIDNRLGPKTINNRKICIQYTLSIWDREEQTDILFRPSPVGPVELCREVNVLEFAQAGGLHADLFKSPNKVDVVVNPNLNFSMDHGWAMLLFRNPPLWTDQQAAGDPCPGVLFPRARDLDGDGDFECFAEYGYPVVGFSAMTAAVGNARLGETVPHKKVRLYYDGDWGPEERVNPDGTPKDPSVIEGVTSNRTL